MRNCKRRWLPFFCLILAVLWLSSAVACGKPGYIVYTNDKFGYAISYPYNWQLEVTEDATACVIKSPSRKASVRIDVTKTLPARDAANRWIMAMGTAWGEVTLLEDKPMKNFWEHYLSYDYDTDFGRYHGEAYFKQTATYLYKLDTAADQPGYDRYPFSSIISSFKLTRR